jgi:hypothetical protein
MQDLKSKRRASVEPHEWAWAREYERARIPPDVPVPRKGDVYACRADRRVDYLTAWSAPFTGGGESVLRAGERVWIHCDPGEERPLGVYAQALDYDALERRMVPRKEREAARYGGFYFYFPILDLARDFDLVATGHVPEKGAGQDGAGW